ncbi:MAG: hypothetical protein KBC84_05175 [Proteobacteria bacterium]|nr:hypothetical protein [Pseudomonadota bacterium]
MSQEKDVNLKQSAALKLVPPVKVKSSAIEIDLPENPQLPASALENFNRIKLSLINSVVEEESLRLQALNEGRELRVAELKKIENLRENTKVFEVQLESLVGDKEIVGNISTKLRELAIEQGAILYVKNVLRDRKFNSEDELKLFYQGVVEDRLALETKYLESKKDLVTKSVEGFESAAAAFGNFGSTLNNVLVYGVNNWSEAYDLLISPIKLLGEGVVNPLMNPIQHLTEQVTESLVFLGYNSCLVFSGESSISFNEFNLRLRSEEYGGLRTAKSVVSTLETIGLTYLMVASGGAGFGLLGSINNASKISQVASLISFNTSAVAQTLLMPIGMSAISALAEELQDKNKLHSFFSQKTVENLLTKTIEGTNSSVVFMYGISSFSKSLVAIRSGSIQRKYQTTIKSLVESGHGPKQLVGSLESFSKEMKGVSLLASRVSEGADIVEGLPDFVSSLENIAEKSLQIVKEPSSERARLLSGAFLQSMAAGMDLFDMKGSGESARIADTAKNFFNLRLDSLEQVQALWSASGGEDVKQVNAFYLPRLDVVVNLNERGLGTASASQRASSLFFEVHEETHRLVQRLGGVEKLFSSDLNELPANLAVEIREIRNVLTSDLDLAEHLLDPILKEQLEESFAYLLAFKKLEIWSKKSHVELEVKIDPVAISVTESVGTSFVVDEALVRKVKYFVESNYQTARTENGPVASLVRGFSQYPSIKELLYHASVIANLSQQQINELWSGAISIFNSRNDHELKVDFVSGGRNPLQLNIPTFPAPAQLNTDRTAIFMRMVEQLMQFDEIRNVLNGSNKQVEFAASLQDINQLCNFNKVIVMKLLRAFYFDNSHRASGKLTTDEFASQLFEAVALQEKIIRFLGIFGQCGLLDRMQGTNYFIRQIESIASKILKADTVKLSPLNVSFADIERNSFTSGLADIRYLGFPGVMDKAIREYERWDASLEDNRELLRRDAGAILRSATGMIIADEKSWTNFGSSSYPLATVNSQRLTLKETVVAMSQQLGRPIRIIDFGCGTAQVWAEVLADFAVRGCIETLTLTSLNDFIEPKVLRDPKVKMSLCSFASAPEQGLKQADLVYSILADKYMPRVALEVVLQHLAVGGMAMVWFSNNKGFAESISAKEMCAIEENLEGVISVECLDSPTYRALGKTSASVVFSLFQFFKLKELV